MYDIANDINSTISKISSTSRSKLRSIAMNIHLNDEELDKLYYFIEHIPSMKLKF